MTDTTDIKALREKFESVFDGNKERNKYHPDVYDAYPTRAAWKYYQMGNELHLSQLEAERQRADAVCRDIRIQANDLKSAQTVNKVLQAEIADLKGDQVPVGKFAGWGLYRADTDSFGSWLTDNPRKETDHAIAKNGYVNVRLFTAPQKPVVLPYGYKPYLVRSQTTATRAAMTSGGEWLHRDEVTSAIEAAGGIVKDGE